MGFLIQGLGCANPIKFAMSPFRERRILTMIWNVLVVLALSLHIVFEGMAVGKYGSHTKWPIISV